MFSLEQAERCVIRSQFGGRSRFIGECRAEAAPNMEVRGRRCQVGRVTLSHLRATTRTCFHRTPLHIAEDGADLAVLWFARKGLLLFEGAGAPDRARAGDLALTRSCAPFLAECIPGAEGVHESLHVIFEAELLREMLGREPGAGGVWRADAGCLAIGARLLADAFEQDGILQPESSIQLVEAALRLVGQGLAREPAPPEQPAPAGERRLREILRFIDLQLTNPCLSRAMAARHCRVSERYLATLLEQHGTTFSDLMWQGRIERARQWLLAADADSVTIAEIAFGLGFKSPAHFTRKFRQACGISPRLFRAQAGAVAR